MIFRIVINAILLSQISICAAETLHLSVPEVERSLNRCYPKILNAALQKEINKAKAQQQQSPFDTKVNAYAQQRSGSTYNTGYQKIELEKRFYDSPISVYTGFDISSGYTPQYDSAQITSTQGREFVGLKFNLLSGFAIDKDRLSLYNSMIDTDKAKYEIELAKLLVKTDAIKAYVTWLISGYELKEYQKLLTIAEARQSNLDRRLKSGDVSAIDVKENYNYILKRKIKLMNAEDYFNQASQSLSLYTRDNQCNMIVPTKKMLPNALPKALSIDKNITSFEEINKAISNRPEFNILNTQISQLKNQQKLANTEYLPKLNLNLQYNQNNSEVTSTSYFRLNQQEGVAKLDFSLPIERSYATGLDSETAKNLEKLHNERQLLIDQISSRLQTLKYTVDLTGSQVNLSEEENKLANQLLSAEETKFKNGDSNFFMINAREENVTNSYISLLSNLSENYKSYIEYNFLNGNNKELKNMVLN
ncbi:MAG: TolC family protein [Burkholderiales bacterium]|nr:TolC family protein [Burkholderiales bacterium]